MKIKNIRNWIHISTFQGMEEKELLSFGLLSPQSFKYYKEEKVIARQERKRGLCPPLPHSNCPLK